MIPVSQVEEVKYRGFDIHREYYEDLVGVKNLTIPTKSYIEKNNEKYKIPQRYLLNIPKFIDDIINGYITLDNLEKFN